MKENLQNVHFHMRELGLAALAHANRHSNYHSPENDLWAELSVLQAAHAAEILIKARIAQEHPLLIFSDIPKSKSEDPLSFKDLVENGRTYQYFDLPHRLWAATGIFLPSKDVYDSFGKLRNSIQHFTRPEKQDLNLKVNEFIFKVIDPFINQCWGLFAIDYDEDYEPYEYLVTGLISKGIEFLVSPEAIEHFSDTSNIEWPVDRPEYRIIMEKRFKN